MKSTGNRSHDPGAGLPKVHHRSETLALFVSWIVFCAASVHGQVTNYVIDTFDSANEVSSNGWGNWFGTAYQSVAWDPSDASNNLTSGSLKITAIFPTANLPNSCCGPQFEVYNGFHGINPPLNGIAITNFQCDLRFDPSSTTSINGGTAVFGLIQFGSSPDGINQDYFGNVTVPASQTNWVHVSLPINAAANTAFDSLPDVLINFYGPAVNPALNGTSIVYVDNIRFVGGPPPPPTPVTNACRVDWNDTHQHIDGFGASSAWNGSWTAAQADLFFSTNVGAGLSLLRTRIAPGGTTVEGSIMKLARDRGAKVWSTPWTPTTNFKTTNSLNDGFFVGTPANYQAYAAQLAGYVVSIKQTYQVSLYALSIQNEPDSVSVGYESCGWTPQEFHDFVPYLHNALVASNVASTRILLAEDEHWQTNYDQLALTDPAVAQYVGIMGGHNYDGGNGPSSLVINNYGKPLWETEVSTFDTYDPSIANGMYWAGRIHRFLTEAQVNAWHFWWLIGQADNEGLTDSSGHPTKRLYVLGQWSRFVRPDYYRIGVTDTAYTMVSAFKDPASSRFAIVAVNTNANFVVTKTFNLGNFLTSGSVTPWVTSATMSLSNQPPISVTGSAFTYTLAPQTIVTFVGLAEPSAPPVLTRVADQAINPGTRLVITNIGPTNLPPQGVSYSLLGAPTNAVLDPLTGNFNWRPLVSQANSINPVAVKVFDTAMPSLAATQNFTVAVNPLAPSQLGAFVGADGRPALILSGPSGPDYTLMTSSNLINWDTLVTTNPPTLPVTLTDPNYGAQAARFYRIQLGP
jgi:glucuronoarabinoxylan endo-1,4-beta-xylanase